MNCEKIKEILLTDYIDGELDEVMRGRIDEHLKLCDECGKFAKTVQRDAINPFKNTEKLVPPDSVWNSVKETLLEEKGVQQKNIFTALQKGLHNIFSVKRPVFAFAAAGVAIMLAVVFMRIPFNSQQVVDNYLQEQVVFLGSLETNGSDYMDFGTSVEEYLL